MKSVLVSMNTDNRSYDKNVVAIEIRMWKNNSQKSLKTYEKNFEI